MAGLSLRAQQLVVSLIGALLIIPLDLFFGGMFSFSYGAQSVWAWLFDLTAFWFQILGILVSFFKPRVAAAWMLLNIGLSIFIGLLVEVRLAHREGLIHPTISEWLRSTPGYVKTAGLFWLAPVVMALLLLRSTSSGENKPAA